MSLSNINGILLSGLTAVNGAAKSALSAINGQTLGGGGNGLLTNLISYWKLDEASGNALDAQSTNTLTAVAAPTAGTGKILGDRICNGTSQYFSHADNTSLSTGDIDFSVAAWINMNNTGATQQIIGKGASGSNDLEYILFYSSGTTQFGFTVSPDGSTGVRVDASTFGTPTISTWIYIVAWHDSVANTINISINNGAVDSVSHSAGVFDGAGAFTLGARSDSSLFFDGGLDESGFWKQALNSTKRGLLYNSGSGLAFSSFS